MAKDKARPTITDAALKAEAQAIVDIRNIAEHQYLPKRGFYVYAILENNRVCYVGKGTKNRVLKHFTNSSNHLLNARIKDNKESYNWIIIDCFDNEFECFDYETQLILDCKQKGHTLYNVTHFRQNQEFHSNLKWLLWLFNRYENFVYADNTDKGLWSTKHSVDNCFMILGWTIEGISSDMMPTYKRIPFDELGYFLTEEFYGNRLYHRVNICHKKDAETKNREVN